MSDKLQIIFHAGAHCTDEDRLLKCLLRNKDDFSAQGIAVPGPGKYRTLLKETFQAMEHAAPAEGARDVLIDAILDEEIASRLVMSNAHFFGSQRYAVGDGQFYPDAPDRVAQLRQLFHQDGLEIFMAIRNPAAFLPAVLQKATPPRIAETLGQCDPRDLRWSDLFARLQAAVPDVPLTVWCNEDLPLIWGELLRTMVGLDMDAKLAGNFDMLAEIMDREGMQRFRGYLHQHPEMTEAQRRKVMLAFLDKYALDEEITEELDLPGWSQDLVEELTELYEDDIDRIAGMDGVRFLAA
ncbi:hypothetical protein [Pseudodonghicola flavimaris]|uniref:Sulfotransferase family protein n=1 Tax=Pseudodonghicola flavimaris TaxID=3050036 RepID=A0ABT7EZ15_9RHOB|nr:hypothetical protein [Pseudodonghicola flavimaris]MDK3017596.1 hypothetical protein [Pseudodonghicola flavimaris]